MLDITMVSEKINTLFGLSYTVIYIMFINS